MVDHARGAERVRRPVGKTKADRHQRKPGGARGVGVGDRIADKRGPAAAGARHCLEQRSGIGLLDRQCVGRNDRAEPVRPAERVDQAQCERLRLVGADRKADPSRGELVERARDAFIGPGAIADVCRIMFEEHRIALLDEGLPGLAGRGKSLAKQSARAVPDQVAHLLLEDRIPAETSKDMVERRGEVRRRVRQRAVEIEGYDVEIDLAHPAAALGGRYGNGKISVRWRRGRSGKLMTPPTPFAAVILAAGMGTRMKSDLHKVLHPVAGRPMIEHLLASVERLLPARVAVVVGSGREQLEPLVAAHAGTLVVQDPQLGTGHAVQQAQQALDGFAGDVLILYGDTPLVGAETMARMLTRLHEPDEPAIVVLASRPADPRAYGRVIAGADGTIAKMVEYKDASAEERACALCNSGLMAVRAADLFGLLGRIGNDNAAGEYYLPDIVMLAARDGRRSVVVETDDWEVAGVNSRGELAAIEGEWQRRRREQAMADGVTLIAPETVWFAHDTAIGRDSVIEPNVVFGPGVTVGERVRIRAFSHIEGARIADGAEIGPYARLRPGAEIGEKAKIGNFVEVKKARFGRGAKANHLSYIGDAEVGADANVGAGTITCNYDGFLKYPTKIGEGAFIGSNSALVAPVVIGKGAIVAAGSVVTRDVADDALALARGSQVEKPGWAVRFREKMAARKKAK